MSDTVSRAGYVAFLRDQDFSAVDLPDNSPWIDTTLAMAQAAMNTTLALVPSLFVIATYNYGADRLVNYAPDQANRTFFKSLREKLAILSFASGLVTSSSDAGTSSSLQTIEAAKDMTLGNLQLAKTPWGRAYLDVTQSYGPTVWGLS